MKLKFLTIFLTIFLFSTIVRAQNTLPQRTSFETDFGVWQQSTNDDLDWIRWHGSTPTPYTGPDTAYDGEYYIYVEADPDNWNPPREASLVGIFDFSTVQNPMLSFYYYMYGDYVNYLEVKISTDSSNWNTLTRIIGNHGPKWEHALMCLGSFAGNDTVYIQISAYTSDDTSSLGDRCDIAIDKLEIVDFRLEDSSHTDVTCGGYSDGSITLSIAGGFPPYRYSIDGGTNWSPYTNDTTYTFDSLSGGSYLVKIESENTCYLEPGAIQVYEPPTPTVTIDTQYVQPCVYSHNGQILVKATDGNAPFTYSINGTDGPFTSDTLFTNLDTGYYHVIVQDNVGCLFDQGLIRIDPKYEILYLGYDKQDVTTCYGDNSGSITINATGGNQPLEYSIDTGNTFTNNSYFPDLTAGQYFVIIQDQSGCRDTTDTITITQPPELVINSINKLDVNTCYGDSTGMIEIYASGGTPPLYYSINNGSDFYPDNKFDSLPAGQYIIWVKDDHDCMAGPDTVVITQPPQLVIDSVTVTDVNTCYGDSTGRIDIYADGGTPTLYYSIDSGQTYQLLNYFDSLPAGDFYPMVKDQAGCTVAYSKVTINQPTQLVINSIIKQDVEGCYGDATGSIAIYASGGTKPYNYSIDSGHTQQTDSAFASLAAGVYYPKVIDAHGCFVYGDSVVITQPDSIVITEQTSTDVNCYGQKTGTIYVNAIGGTAPLYYSIDGGSSFPYQVGNTVDVYAGTYQIVVRDVNNCTAVGSTLVVNQPPQLKIDTVFVQDVNTCFGDSTGSIKIRASGGVAPYMYSIDNGATFQTDSVFDSLPAASNYYPFVKDAHNCYVGYDYVSIHQPSPLVINQVQHTDIDTCHGVPVGTITITASGGTSPYYYSIDSGNTYETTNFFDHLYAGDYYIFVKDDHNCSTRYNAPVTIRQPDTLTLDSIIAHDITCHGYQNGNVTIYASGGQPQLMYTIMSPTDTFTSITNYFQSLRANTYNVTVRDAYNCQVHGSFTINEPPALVIDTVIYTDVQTCYGDSTASIAVSAHGGTNPLQYAYYNLSHGQSPFQLDTLFDNLPAGSYYVIVQDQNGCRQTSESFTIDQPSPVVLNRYDVTPITCYGDDDAQLLIEASGGQGDYYFSIDSGLTWSPDSVFTNLGPGHYVLAVKDINNCFADYHPAVDINEPDSLYIDTVYIYDVSCHGYTDGHIKILAAGGTLPRQYSLDSATFQSDNDFYDLPPGYYTAYVVDAHGCYVKQDSLQIHEPPNYAEFTADTTEGCSPLVVHFQAVNPNAYFSWDFGDSSSTASGPDITHVFYNDQESYRTYTVRLQARNGSCIDSAQMDITLYPAPHLQIDIDSTVNYYPDTIVRFFNHTTEYEDFTWDYGDSTYDYVTQPLQHAYPGCGTYLLQVSARNYLGCYDTLRQTITITAVDPVASFSMDQNDGCAPLTVNFYNSSSNAQAYLWDFGDGDTSTLENPTHTFVVGKNYLVKLKAIGYCDKSDEYERPVYVYPTPVIDFYVDPDTAGVGQPVGFYNLTTGASYYLWDFGDSTYSTEENPRKSYSMPGMYTVTLIARSSSGCTDSLTKKNAVYILGDLLIKFPNAFTPDGDGRNDYFKPVLNLVKEAELYIFDRYGNVVFHTTHPDKEFWDGTINGKPAPNDVYVWKIVGKFVNGQTFVKVGDVTLLR